MRPETISVILATYDAPAALRASLESFARQTDRGFEAVVADDGSTAETGELLAALAPRLPFPLRRAWQEDSGFRLARARNLAIARARGDYAVFVDGDCLVLPDFIAWHRRLARPGHFVSGKRSWLRAGTSARWLARPRGRGRWLLEVRGAFRRRLRRARLFVRQRMRQGAERKQGGHRAGEPPPNGRAALGAAGFRVAAALVHGAGL